MPSELSRPLDDQLLDAMYDHPERFGHLAKEEYVRLLIEDIRHARKALASYNALFGPALLEAVHMAETYGTVFIQVTRRQDGSTEARTLDPHLVTVSVQT